MTPRDASAFAHEICGLAPVIPVLVVEEVAQAAPLAGALVKGGLGVLEVTFRTRAAPDVIRAMRDAVPDAVIGAGTLLTPADVSAAVAAGAAFGVSPGATPALMDAAAAAGLPMLPGAATASEMMAFMEMGIEVMKFFPAGPAGGVPYLKAIAGPLPQVAFCPTGGVSLANMADYLKLPNVLCVGGSWVAPAKAVAAGDWAVIETLAREAFEAGRAVL
jgi:2-dehydro-3-deoxyphosphogluconate aldolase/(4S)-4-hydroxy-2-oxoglutarate aldolase